MGTTPAELAAIAHCSTKELESAAPETVTGTVYTFPPPEDTREPTLIWLVPTSPAVGLENTKCGFVKPVTAC